MAHGLTVTEKEHWKSRIERRINDKIETIKSDNAAFFAKLNATAHQRAIKALGISSQFTRLDAINEEKRRLSNEEEHIRRKLTAKIRGVPPSEIAPHINTKYVIDDAVNIRTRHEERLLLDKSPVGRRIARLNREKDGLLDTVWLATSPTQIRELWTSVDSLLGAESTPLQQSALATQPPSDVSLPI